MVFFFYQNNQIVHMVPIYMFIFSPNVKGLSIIDFQYNINTRSLLAVSIIPHSDKLLRTCVLQTLDYFKGLIISGKKVDKLYLSYISDDLKLKRNKSGSNIYNLKW